MYTSELLQEKYKAQKLLTSGAKDWDSYFKLIDELARDTYKHKSRKLVFAKREGGYIEEKLDQNIPAGRR